MARATPPISAARVRKVMKNDAARLTRATLAPRRSRTRSKVARLDTVATRPAISANRRIPMTPRTTTQASDIPKRAPVSVLATMSPMSTNPPMAVRMPRATEKSRFTHAPRRRRGAARPARPGARPARPARRSGPGGPRSAARPGCRWPGQPARPGGRGARRPAGPAAGWRRRCPGRRRRPRRPRPAPGSGSGRRPCPGCRRPRPGGRSRPPRPPSRRSGRPWTRRRWWNRPGPCRRPAAAGSPTRIVAWHPAATQSAPKETKQARSPAELVDLVLDQGLGGGQLVGLAAQERLGEALGLLELDLAGHRRLVGVDHTVDHGRTGMVEGGPDGGLQVAGLLDPDAESAAGP